MSAAVVDTNVLVVANARETHAGPECVLACVDALNRVRERLRLVVDDGRRIVREYGARVSDSGQPGVGDAFLKWVLVNLANPDRCEMATITPRGGSDEDFEEFPLDPELTGFDRADRKFVAVARACSDQPPILNATDTDWRGFRDPLERHGVTIVFLCPALMNAPRRPRTRRRGR